MPSLFYLFNFKNVNKEMIILALQKRDLFNCHSIKLFHFLKQKGFYYLSKGLNEHTGFNYWVFEVTPEFESALNEYKQVKHIFK